MRIDVETVICFGMVYLAVLAGLSDFTAEQLHNADVNGDGVVSILDATNIQKYLVGLVEI